MIERGRKHGVCLLTETFHPLTGGGETQARVVARGLVNSGFNVILITRRTDRQLPSVAELDGVLVRRLAPAGKAHLKKWGLCLTALAELLRRRREYDALLVCGYRVLGIPAMLASLILGKPCILKADSLGELSGVFFDPGLARFGMSHESWPVSVALRARNWLMRRAHGFIAISSAVTDELLESGIERDEIYCIPNSVDVNLYVPVDGAEKKSIRSRLGIGQDRPVAVFTGRLVTTKGLPLLLRVWQRVVDSRPDALLVLVGSGGLGLQNCEQEIRAFVSEHGLAKHVAFTGSIENVRDYLQAADVFVFPSQRESFGISAVEAMASGLPVVASDIPGLSDVVVPGETAQVVPAQDEAALYDAVMRILSDRDLARTLGEAGRKRAALHFSESAVVESYADLLGRLVEGGMRRRG